MKLSKDKYESYTVKGLNNQIFLTYNDALYASNYDDSKVKPKLTEEQKAYANEASKRSVAKNKADKKAEQEAKELTLSLMAEVQAYNNDFDSRFKPKPMEEQKAEANKVKADKKAEQEAKKRNNEIENNMGVDTDNYDADFTQDNQLIQSN